MEDVNLVNFSYDLLKDPVFSIDCLTYVPSGNTPPYRKARRTSLYRGGLASRSRPGSLQRIRRDAQQGTRWLILWSKAAGECKERISDGLTPEYLPGVCQLSWIKECPFASGIAAPPGDRIVSQSGCFSVFICAGPSMAGFSFPGSMPSCAAALLSSFAEIIPSSANAAIAA